MQKKQHLNILLPCLFLIYSLQATQKAPKQHLNKTIHLCTYNLLHHQTKNPIYYQLNSNNIPYTNVTHFFIPLTTLQKNLNNTPLSIVNTHLNQHFHNHPNHTSYHLYIIPKTFFYKPHNCKQQPTHIAGINQPIHQVNTHDQQHFILATITNNTKKKTLITLGPISPNSIQHFIQKNIKDPVLHNRYDIFGYTPTNLTTNKNSSPNPYLLISTASDMTKTIRKGWNHLSERISNFEALTQNNLHKQKNTHKHTPCPLNEFSTYYGVLKFINDLYHNSKYIRSLTDPNKVYLWDFITTKYFLHNHLHHNTTSTKPYTPKHHLFALNTNNIKSIYYTSIIKKIPIIFNQDLLSIRKTIANAYNQQLNHTKKIKPSHVCLYLNKKNTQPPIPIDTKWNNKKLITLLHPSTQDTLLYSLDALQHHTTNTNSSTLITKHIAQYTLPQKKHNQQHIPNLKKTILIHLLPAHRQGLHTFIQHMTKHNIPLPSDLAIDPTQPLKQIQSHIAQTYNNLLAKKTIHPQHIGIWLSIQHPNQAPQLKRLKRTSMNFQHISPNNLLTHLSPAKIIFLYGLYYYANLLRPCS